MTPSDETSSLSTVLGKRKSPAGLTPSADSTDLERRVRDSSSDEDVVSTMVEGAAEDDVDGELEGERGEEQREQEGALAGQGSLKRMKLESE